MDVASFALNPGYALEHIRSTNTVNALQGADNDQNASGLSDNSTFKEAITMPNQIQTSVPKSQSNFVIEQVRHVYLSNGSDAANHMYYKPGEEVYEQKYLQKYMVSFLRVGDDDDEKIQSPMNCIGIATMNRLLKDKRIEDEQTMMRFIKEFDSRQESARTDTPSRSRMLTPWHGITTRYDEQMAPDVKNSLRILAQWRLDGVLQASDILEYQKGNTSHVTLNTVIFGRCFLINDDSYIKSKAQNISEACSQFERQSFALKFYADRIDNSDDKEVIQTAYTTHMNVLNTLPSVSKSFHSFDANPTYGDMVLLLVVIVRDRSDFFVQYRPYTLIKLYKYFNPAQTWQQSYRYDVTYEKMIEELNFCKILGAYSIGRITDALAVGDTSGSNIIQLCVNPKFIAMTTLQNMLAISNANDNRLSFFTRE